MELRQLEYFKVVSQLNNITRAAEQFHVSQPSITIAIQKLEDELGVQLLDRSQKRITLTVEGQVFLQRIESILANLQDAIVEMNDYKQFQKGTLKLGIPPMIGAYLFPHIFLNFHKQFPHLELSVVEEGSLSIMKMLETNELDIGITILSHVSPLLDILPISTNQILLCLPKHHAFSDLQVVSFENLHDQPFILFKEDYYHRQLIFEECAKHNFAPKVVLSSNQIETIKGLVAAGVGVTLLLDVIARKDNNIVSLPLSDPLHIKIGVVWRKDKYFPQASRAFVEFIIDYFSSPISPEVLYPSY